MPDVRINPTGDSGPTNEPAKTSPNQARQGRADAVERSGLPSVDAQVQSTQKPYIAMAMAGDEINTQAVEEAKALLQSGQLDTPEAARRAAEAILSFGV